MDEDQKIGKDSEAAHIEAVCVEGLKYLITW